MLIRFAVSNFLSFDGREELSLKAGKARKHSERLYVNRRLKVVKCEALFGSNASGKSNLIAVSYTHLDVYKRQGTECFKSKQEKDHYFVPCGSSFFLFGIHNIHSWRFLF